MASTATTTGIASFSEWLYNTPLSQAIQTTAWVIPTVQSIHILAISVLIGSAILLDLRLAGLVAADEPARTIARRYMPWLFWALLLLLLTGLLMVIGEPERALSNWVFWTKMALVLIAFTITWIMRWPMLREDFDVTTSVWRHVVKPMGLLSLAIWVGIIFCGRWIAYSI